MQEEKAINSFLGSTSPVMEKELGAGEGRIKRQQESILIKSTAGKSALAGTGLSLQISMNWEGKTA